MAKDLEELTKDTHIISIPESSGVGVGASVTRSQVGELPHALEELGEALRGKA